MAVEDLIFRMRADTRDAIAGFDRVGKSANKNLSGVDKQVGKTQAAFGAMGKFVASAAVAGAVVNFAKKAITAASDLAETQSKTTAIFKESGAEILKWSKSSASALGQSERQALDAASSFAVFGKAAGLSGDELVKFSTKLVGLATDLASLHGTDVQSAIQAISSGLAGESEPLKRYAVLVQDATLRQTALATGLIKSNRQLSQQEKILATNAALFQQTADAQGDFSRTSGQFAGQSKILGAQFENLLAELGNGLLPAAVSVTSALIDLTNAAKPLVPIFTGMLGAAGGTAGTASSPFKNPGKTAATVAGFAIAGPGGALLYNWAYGAAVDKRMVGVPFSSTRDVGTGNTIYDQIFNQRQDLQNRLAYQSGRLSSNNPGARGVGMGTTRDHAAERRGRWFSEAAANAAALAGAAMRASLAIAAVDRAWGNLTGALSDQSSLLDLRDGFDAVVQAQKDAEKGAKRGGLVAEQSAREAERAVIQLKEQVISYGGEILGLPPEVVTKFLAQIDAGDLAFVEQQLEILSRNRTVSLSIVAKGGIGYTPLTGQTKARAHGGPVSAGSPYIVGEEGPELFVPGKSGTIVPNGASVGGGVVIQNVNVYGVQDGQSLVEELRRYERRAGTGWRS